MKQLLVLGSMASFLTVCAIGYLTIASRSPLPDSPSVEEATVRSPRPPLPVPPSGAVASVDRLTGAYLWTREAGEIVRVQIQEFVWGVKGDGTIGVAVLKALKEDGQVIDYSRPDLYQRLAYSPDELANSYFEYKDGSRVTVEHISYRIDDEGTMAISDWIGRDRNGRSFVYDDTKAQLTFVDDPNPIPPGKTCCRQLTLTECLTANGCTTGCAGPTSCGCTAPAGSSCYMAAGPSCVGACGGICHTGSCGGTPPACACH
jgi:hypothetical protein